MFIKKPYQSIPIEECHESLVPIPKEHFILEIPHPYEKLGADYQGRSPYFLRESVLSALIIASDYLKTLNPDYCLKIFDAYRPISVQQFMVDYTFEELVHTQNLSLATLSVQEKESLLEQVYQFWAIPSFNPATPPPHSTGSAVDLTLMTSKGEPVEMGGSIDEISSRSTPNYYQNSLDPQEKIYHQNRELLNRVMTYAGFQRHLQEWWHFSLGDQMWVWLNQQQNLSFPPVAKYGSITSN